MSSYRPGQGISGDALERLRARKTAQSAVADIPAADDSQQWDRLLGVAAKKKLRCGVCTKPLSEEDQCEKRIVCLACSRGSSSSSVRLSAETLVTEEFQKCVFYFCLQAAPASVTSSQDSTDKKTENPAVTRTAASTAPAQPNANENLLPTLERGIALNKQHALVPKGRTPLSVLSFNLLADCYVRVEGQPWNAFAHCEDSVLNWDARLPKIVHVLQSFAADIICLQEVVMELRYEEWNLPEWMQQLQSYTPVLQGFKQKEWEGQAERNKRMVGVKAPTGVVTLYNSERFTESAPSKAWLWFGADCFFCVAASRWWTIKTPSWR